MFLKSDIRELALDQLRASDAKFSHYIMHFDDKNFLCGSQSSKQLELLIAFTVSRISRVESKIFFASFSIRSVMSFCGDFSG